MELNKYSIGIGDRFIHQAKAQLNAVKKTEDAGVFITLGGENHLIPSKTT